MNRSWGLRGSTGNIIALGRFSSIFIMHQELAHQSVCMFACSVSKLHIINHGFQHASLLPLEPFRFPIAIFLVAVIRPRAQDPAYALTLCIFSSGKAMFTHKHVRLLRRHLVRIPCLTRAPAPDPRFNNFCFSINVLFLAMRSLERQAAKWESWHNICAISLDGV